MSAVAVVDLSIPAQFAAVVQEVSSQEDPFDVVRRFRSICSTKALQVRDESPQEFEEWLLETKLWHLAEVLYSLRVAEPEDVVAYPYSSTVVKEDVFTRKNTKIAELGHIISWLQFNSESESTEVPLASKWRNTKIEARNSSLNSLVNKESSDYITELDSDAPLRSGKKIHPDDASVDSQVFRVIYHLLLGDKIEDAIKIARESGNFTLAMILIGYIRPYFDPVLDAKYLEAIGAEEYASTPAGAKHPLLWRKTVYKLSQAANLNKYEKMIYTFLSGGDISANINDTESWDTRLLLYCTQAVIHEKILFYEKTFASEPSEDLSICIPKPQLTEIKDILNTLQVSGGKVAEQSRNPLRTIAGAVMIRQISSILGEVVNDVNTTRNPLVYKNSHIMRILSHLAIFINSIDGEAIDQSVYNKVLMAYISKLVEDKLYDLIPTYMTFVQDDAEVRESYSKILASIEDPAVRAKQVSITRKLPYFRTPVEGTPEVNATDDRIAITLRRTVERIISETNHHYQPAGQVVVHDTPESIDNIDRKLFNSVEWFINNQMYEDTIVASLVIIKRFLLTGKLGALKEFSRNKKFKNIIVHYDSETETRTLDNTSYNPAVSEEDKEELLSYNSFIEGIELIDQWKHFVGHNAFNGAESIFVKGTDVNNSVEKTTKKLHQLILTWFVNSQSPILREFRSLYVPYLIIALLKIYETSRHIEWGYIQKSFDLIKQVANEDENDLLSCFISSGRLPEFLQTCGQLSLVAGERGMKGIFN